MPRTGWKIRFYETDDYNKTVDVVGNYPRWGSRYDDDVVAFVGIYGIGDYLLWYMEKNIDNYDFGAVRLDLSLYINSKRFFQRQYAVRDIKYDMIDSRYVLYAISRDTQILNTPLVDYNIQSISYDDKRKAEQILVDVLETNNILRVQFEKHTKKQIEFEYRQLTFNLDDKVYDFIRYIADDSGFEWFVRNRVLYIGPELHIRKKMRSASKFEDMTENMSQTSIFRKISGKSRPMDILSNWQESWRCLWAKHAAGRCGGISKGLFARRGSGQINKKLYYQTLEGEIERGLGSKLLSRNYTSSYTSIGNILKDDGDLKFIDQVSVQRNMDGLGVRTPRDVKIDRGDPVFVQHMKEKISRSTPYADVDAGLFFPSPKLNSAPPNVLIHNIDGREEASVIGNYILGNGRDISLPVKNKDDLRLKLPGDDGGNIFWDGKKKHWVIDGERIMFKNIVTKAGESVSSTYSNVGAHITIFKEDSIKLENEDAALTLFEGGCFWVIAKKYKLQFDGTDGELQILCDGKIIINSDGNITIDGLTVKLQGGGNKLSHGDHKHGYTHTHTTGNMGMPIPPQTHIPGIVHLTDQHLPTEGTTTTEAE